MHPLYKSPSYNSPLLFSDNLKRVLLVATTADDHWMYVVTFTQHQRNQVQIKYKVRLTESCKQQTLVIWNDTERANILHVSMSIIVGEATYIHLYM